MVEHSRSHGFEMTIFQADKPPPPVRPIPSPIVKHDSELDDAHNCVILRHP